MNRRIKGWTGFLPAALLLAGCATAQQPIDLPGDRLFPENVSIAADGTAYVASVTGGVLRVTLATGKVETWIEPGGFGSGALFGVLVDPRNNLLWTCTNDFTARGVTVPGADAGSWLKGFDLATGEGKLSLALPDAGAVCNDMTVGSDGAVYVADTGHPRILRWTPGAQALETWVTDPALGVGLDGLAFASDGHLYVNNVRTGALYRIAMGQDGKAGAVTTLETSRPLGSPDGMRSLGGMDLAVAESQGRIARLSIKGDHVEVTTLAEGIASPTGLDPHEGTIWYVQGQVGALMNPDTPRPSLPFRLTPLPLR